MPPKWKGGAGRDWSTCDCTNCRWLWTDTVPSDVPELQESVAYAEGSPFGDNRLDRLHKQLHILLPCLRPGDQGKAPAKWHAALGKKEGQVGQDEAEFAAAAAAAGATKRQRKETAPSSALPNRRAREHPEQKRARYSLQTYRGRQLQTLGCIARAHVEYPLPQSSCSSRAARRKAPPTRAHK